MGYDNNGEQLVLETNETTMLPKYNYLEILLRNNHYISREEYVTIIDGNVNNLN